MAQMTGKEAEYWDEYYTKNPPKTGPAKPGVFAGTAEPAMAGKQLKSNRYRRGKEIGGPYSSTD
jgi:hypothetical protein